MTIILDAMGSDTYPDPEIEGALNAARDFGEEIILVGKEDILKSKIASNFRPGSPIRIVHAADVLEMTDKPVEGSRQKPDNSMAVGLELVKKGVGRAFVSAGNTGGVLFTALRKLGRIKGVQRPGLAPVLPTKTGRCVLIDSGANTDCRPEFLLEFAIMASLYSKVVLKVKDPRVGLLSNDEEETKGNELVHAAYPLLAASRHINFAGSVEPKEVYQGLVDVVVMDGFVGNVFIKSSEAVAKLITDTLRTELKANPVYMLGGALAKPAFTRLRAMMNPEDIGAAILLGVDGLAFVGHGRSNARAIYSAIRYARLVADLNLMDALRTAIQTALIDVVVGD